MMPTRAAKHLGLGFVTYSRLRVLHVLLLWLYLSCVVDSLIINSNKILLEKLIDGTDERIELVTGTEGLFFYPRLESANGPAIKKYGHWELPLKNLLFSLMDDLWPASTSEEHIVIFDVGANFGTWTVPLGQKIRHRGKVYSFEVRANPSYFTFCQSIYSLTRFLSNTHSHIQVQRTMLAYLHTNILFNKLSNVYPMHLALSNITGHYEMEDAPQKFGLINHGGFSLNSLSVRFLLFNEY